VGTVAAEDDVDVVVEGNEAVDGCWQIPDCSDGDWFVSHNSSLLSADIKEGCARRLGWGGLLVLLLANTAGI